MPNRKRLKQKANRCLSLQRVKESTMKLLFALFFFGTAFIVQSVHAEYVRNRDTVGKSSYTESQDLNVQLSSAPSFVRSITFSGMLPSTVTIYNAQLFASHVSTRAKVYFPGGLQPITVNVDTVNSSGTVYTKAGGAFVSFNWDWIVMPSYANPLNFGN